MAKKKSYVTGSKVTDPQGFFVIAKPEKKEVMRVHVTDGTANAWVTGGWVDSIPFFDDKKAAHEWLKAASAAPTLDDAQGIVVDAKDAAWWQGATVVPAAKFFAIEHHLEWDGTNPYVEAEGLEWKRLSLSATQVIKAALADQKDEHKHAMAELKKLEKEMLNVRKAVKESAAHMASLTKLLGKAKR